MGKNFTAQILTSEEFDSLPYRNISDSLGIADVQKGLVFVRDTGVHELNMETLQHEIDHLVEKYATDEDEDGIRHKKFKDVLKNVVAPVALSLIPGVGPVLAGAYSGINTYQDTGSIGKSLLSGGLSFAGGKLGQSTKGYMSGVAGSKAAGGGIIGQTLSGAKGILGMGTSLPSTLNGTSQAANIAGQGASKIASGFVPGVASTGAAGSGALSAVGAGVTGASGLLGGLKLSGDTSKVGGNVPIGLDKSTSPNLLGNASPNSGVMNPINPTSVSGGGALAGANAASKEIANQATGKAFSFKDLITPNTIGAASLLGAVGTPQPQFEMPDSVEQLRKKLQEGQGLTPLGQQAQSELQGILKSTPQELYPTANNEYYNAALRRTRESYAEAEKQLDAAYNNAGMFGSGEHMAQKAKLKEELARTESGLFAQTEQRNFELARTQKYQAVQDSLNVDKATMDDLVGLTGLDVQQAAAIYGARAADVQAIREALGTIGVEMILKGQGVNRGNSGININVR